MKPPLRLSAFNAILANEPEYKHTRRIEEWHLVFLPSRTTTSVISLKCVLPKTWLRRVLTSSPSYQQAGVLTLRATQRPLDMFTLLVCITTHLSVASNANHARPFRCPHEGHASRPSIPPPFYPNNLETNTSPNM
jgi:hypothetical protein